MIYNILGNPGMYPKGPARDKYLTYLAHSFITAEKFSNIGKRPCQRRYDSQDNDIQHYDIQHKRACE
jgi:hypothetical protein